MEVVRIRSYGGFRNTVMNVSFHKHRDLLHEISNYQLSKEDPGPCTELFGYVSRCHDCTSNWIQHTKQHEPQCLSLSCFSEKTGK
jgi:hypothetical protein